MKPLNKYPGLIQRILIGVFVLTVGTISILFYQHRAGLDRADRDGPEIQNDTSISIQRLNQTMMREGKKDWTLNASSAKYDDQKKQVLLENLSITFFLEKNRRVMISADQGLLKSESKNISVSGNVVVKHENSNLSTDELLYSHDTRIISTRVPVKIVSDTYRLTADRISMNLNTNETTFEGHVRGFFSDRITL